MFPSAPVPDGRTICSEPLSRSRQQAPSPFIPLTNLLERTFGESRRRVKVIGRLPGEYSCLSLVWAVLDRASVGWRGIDTSVAGIRRLQDLRRQLLPSDLLAATG